MSGDQQTVGTEICVIVISIIMTIIMSIVFQNCIIIWSVINELLRYFKMLFDQFQVSECAIYEIEDQYIKD